MSESNERSELANSLDSCSNYQEILLKFLDSASHFAIIKDTSFRYVSVNKPFLELLGHKDASLILGKTDEEIFQDILDQEQLSEIKKNDRKACTLPAGEHITTEIVINSEDSAITLSSKKFPIRADNGTLLGIGVLVYDISKRKLHELELLNSKHELKRHIRNQDETIRSANENLQFLKRVFQNTLDGIIITDAKGKALQINPAFTDITGYTLDEIRGENPRVLKSNYHPPEFYQEMWKTIAKTGSWEGELWNRRKSGEIYPQRLSISAIYDSKGNVTHYVGVNNDISELKRKEEKIHFYAYHDALTNLPNRKLFADRLRRELQKAKNKKYKIALFYMDLNDFKKVNDSSGYNVGDELLKQISERIKELIGESDILARLGSDEFAVAVVDFENINTLISFAKELNDSLTKVYLIEGQDIFINSSIGIAIYPDDTESPEQLVLHADTAMHQVKGNHMENFRFYTSQMKLKAQRKLDMDSAIRKAIVNGEFIPFYQAKVSCTTQKVVGMEALARWVKPDGTIIPPSDFIPLAEELNLISEIDGLIIRQAIQDMAIWEKSGHANLIVSANISAKELDDPEFADRIFQLLEENSMAKNQLELEVTESLIMRDVEKSTRILDELCTSGINCSIDDFGTGYSSLSYLKKLPIKTLKIDKSFVQDILKDNNDLAIVCAIISMSKRMGLNVVAEGVEDAEQAALLKQEGCNIIQGYYYSKPLAKGDFLEFLNGNREGLFLEE